LWKFFYFFLFLLGVYGAYLKLYDKNSWLYKESQQEKWSYNFDSQGSWRIILLLIIGGGGAFFSWFNWNNIRYYKEIDTLKKHNE